MPPPEDWIQFEIVCKKVWGLLWNIPNEIDLNSTNSQGQHGIDIVGIPNGEKQYFGIQCKNKRFHLKTGEKNKITTALIDDEIRKAFDFVPKLKHLIIATSLYKDRKIEEYVRLKNVDHIAESKFTVQICFWEYISETIQENKQLYNWYLGQRNFVFPHRIEVLFDNRSKQKYFYPEFIKEKRIYRHQTENEIKQESERYCQAFENLKDFGFYTPWHQKLKEFFTSLFRRKRRLKESDLLECKILVDGKPLEREFPERADRFADLDLYPSHEIHQGAYFSLLIRNVGANVIEDYKLSFSLEGDFEEFMKEIPRLTDVLHSEYPRHSWKTGERTGAIQPKDNFLIQKDEFESHSFYILPRKDIPTKVILHWELLARDYSDKGSVDLFIEPKFIEKESLWYIHPNNEPYEEYYYHNKKKSGPFIPNL